MTLKRSFEIQSSSKEDNNEVTLKQMRIDLCAQTKSAWDKDGLKTLEVNRAIMEFIATDIQPFSVVQDSGFKRLIALLKPQYNLPSRNFFSEKMLPCIYESVKKRVIKDLLQAEAISVTFDAWTAKNSTHSLLSFTAHFVQNSVPEFRVISAKPIKGRHNAIVLEDMIREILADFG
uniref:Uncharacterized protein n=1 Tax=Meloidogyne enterolobii TaxID=390850 RepID=A0A6V7W852_MELEN|nr:unnamed protein product [Meloidogyne enterolobii]